MAAAATNKPKKTHYLLCLHDGPQGGKFVEQMIRYRIPMEAKELKLYSVLLGADGETRSKWYNESIDKLTEQKVKSKYNNKKVGVYQEVEIWDMIRKLHPLETDGTKFMEWLDTFQVAEDSSEPFEVKPDELVWVVSIDW